MSMSGRNRIRAVVRCRPVTDEDYQCCRLKRHLLEVCIGVKPDKRTLVVTKDTYITKEVKVDQAYGVATSQKHLYEQACKDVVADVSAGYHGSILSYGQTGSGKTYTMFGAGHDAIFERSPMEPTHGIAHYALFDIFSLMEARQQEGLFCALQMSMFQIYQEGITDLLTEPANLPNDPFSASFKKEEAISMFKMKQRLLDIREYPDKSIMVDGLSHHPVAEVEDAISLLYTGLSNRVTRSVTANEHSSRSHVIVQLSVTCQDAVGDGGTYNQKVRTSTLMLVDLAGSERIRKSGSIDDSRTMNEAQSINKSISTLGLCINTLATAGDKGVQAAHVPFRNSKLTRILAESIGGKARACIIATIGPCLYNVEETLSTLQFAKRCTAVKKNVKRVKAKLPNLFDDKLIAWTWQSKSKSPGDGFEMESTDLPTTLPSSPRDQAMHEYTLINNSSKDKLSEADSRHSIPTEDVHFDYKGAADDYSIAPQTLSPLGRAEPITPCSDASVRWIRYCADHSGVSMFTPLESFDSKPVSVSDNDVNRGLLVLLPESSLLSSHIRIDTNTDNGSVSIRILPDADDPDIQATELVSSAQEENGALRDDVLDDRSDDELNAAEALFQLYSDDDGSAADHLYFDRSGVCRRDSLTISSSSSGSPVSLDETGSLSPHNQSVETDGLRLENEDCQHIECTNVLSPIAIVSSSGIDRLEFGAHLLNSPALIEPEEDRFLSYGGHPALSNEQGCLSAHKANVKNVEETSPELDILSANTTGINSPKHYDRKKIKPLGSTYISELSSIFDGEDSALRSPIRKLSTIVGAPPVIPTLEIPSRSDQGTDIRFNSDSFDSEDMGSDRSDLMAKMTDSPPNSRIQINDPPRLMPANEIKNIDDEIQALVSKQQSIKTMLDKLNGLYLDGEQKLAVLLKLKCQNYNLLSVSSESDDNDDTSDNNKKATDSFDGNAERDNVHCAQAVLLEDTPQGTSFPLSGDSDDESSIDDALNLDSAAGDSSDARRIQEIDMPVVDCPVTISSEASLSGHQSRRLSLDSSQRFMTRRHSLSDVVPRRRSSMSEYLLASSPTLRKNHASFDDSSDISDVSNDDTLKRLQAEQGSPSKN